jgi:hypothetical protein
MPSPDRAAPPAVYLLADHLDAALAMAEDLLTERLRVGEQAAGTGQRAIERQGRELAQFVTGIRTLETALAARVLQARKRAEETRKLETRFKPLVQLFHAGTAPLVDAVDELAEAARAGSGGADAHRAYLRARGIITTDPASFADGAMLAPSEEFLVAGRVRLGTLMDLIATFLDCLDLAFDLYTGNRASGLAIPGDVSAVSESGLQHAPDVFPRIH